jgi:hypothetical protein
MTGPTGDGTRQTAEAILDGGCTFPLVIDVATYAKLASTLGPLTPSRTRAKGVGGTLTNSQGSVPVRLRPTGGETTEDVTVHAHVIDSNGAFKLLLGKPWMDATLVIHFAAEEHDIVWIPQRRTEKPPMASAFRPVVNKSSPLSQQPEAIPSSPKAMLKEVLRRRNDTAFELGNVFTMWERTRRAGRWPRPTMEDLPLEPTP